jgi:hypothetical protein
VNHYLVVFDRASGEVLRRHAYSDPRAALAARFAEERQHHGEPSIEVVVLGAESWDALLRTHGRYFKNFRELAAEATG